MPRRFIKDRPVNTEELDSALLTFAALAAEKQGITLAAFINLALQEKLLSLVDSPYDETRLNIGLD